MFTTCWLCRWLWQMTRQQDQDWVISIQEQTSSKKTTRALDKLIWSCDNKPTVMCCAECLRVSCLLCSEFLVQTLPTLQANSELKWWKETIVRIATDQKTQGAAFIWALRSAPDQQKYKSLRYETIIHGPEWCLGWAKRGGGVNLEIANQQSNWLIKLRQRLRRYNWAAEVRDFPRWIPVNSTCRLPVLLQIPFSPVHLEKTTSPLFGPIQ